VKAFGEIKIEGSTFLIDLVQGDSALI